MPHARPRRARVLLAVPAAVAALATGVVPAAAASGDGHARGLDRTVATQSLAVSSAQQRLADLGRRANAALDDLVAARGRASAAAAAAQRARAAERTAAAATARAHARLDAYASEAYRSGGVGSESVAMMQVLTGQSPTAVADRLSTMRVVGASHTNALVALRAAQEQRRDAARQAGAAAGAADRATAEATAAKRAADRLVAEQSALVARMQRTLDAGRAAQARAHAEAMVAGMAGNGLARCAGGDVDRYPNGAIPPAMLCPLWGAPSQMLRKEAAAAFDAMSRAYADSFGAPICVTSSYRSYADQQRVKGERGHWAAAPGASPHGLARAVDLCGGVQSDGTPQHDWMAANAARFDFFHPAWAQPGGALPEPWHWEWAG